MGGEETALDPTTGRKGLRGQTVGCRYRTVGREKTVLDPTTGRKGGGEEEKNGGKEPGDRTVRGKNEPLEIDAMRGETADRRSDGLSQDRWEEPAGNHVGRVRRDRGRHEGGRPADSGTIPAPRCDSY